jgi:hypothetical protein
MNLRQGIAGGSGGLEMKKRGSSLKLEGRKGFAGLPTQYNSKSIEGNS